MKRTYHQSQDQKLNCSTCRIPVEDLVKDQPDDTRIFKLRKHAPYIIHPDSGLSCIRCIDSHLYVYRDYPKPIERIEQVAFYTNLSKTMRSSSVSSSLSTISTTTHPLPVTHVNIRDQLTAFIGQSFPIFGVKHDAKDNRMDYLMKCIWKDEVEDIRREFFKNIACIQINTSCLKKDMFTMSIYLKT